MNEFVEGGAVTPETSENMEVATTPENEAAVIEKQELPAKEQIAASGDVIPEAYEFNLPEGFELNTEAVELFTPIAKEMGLSQEKAQALAEVYAEIQKKEVEKRTADYEKRQQEHYEAVMKNPEFGGANFEKNAGAVRNLLAKFDKDGKAAKALEETGVANHPDLFGLMYRISKAISEDSVVTGASAKTAPKSAAEVMFEKSLA